MYGIPSPMPGLGVLRQDLKATLNWISIVLFLLLSTAMGLYYSTGRSSIPRAPCHFSPFSSRKLAACARICDGWPVTRKLRSPLMRSRSRRSSPSCFPWSWRLWSSSTALAISPPWCARLSPTSGNPQAATECRFRFHPTNKGFFAISGLRE